MTRPLMWQPLLDRTVSARHLWTDELAFLGRPGQQDIQTDLFYDYRTNVVSYPAWQDWLRKRQPPLQVVWGRYDPSFQV